jgi:succinate dehydrogenase hydrophobic anchor subunit
VTYALFFHLYNGIRHLFWDAGYGFELKTIYASGWTVVAVSIVLMMGARIIGFNMHGQNRWKGKKKRSPFDQPQGLGSARAGAGHWWMQRVTAVALVPLTLCIAASLIARPRRLCRLHPVAPYALDDVIHLGCFAPAVVGIIATSRIVFAG